MSPLTRGEMRPRAARAAWSCWGRPWHTSCGPRWRSTLGWGAATELRSLAAAPGALRSLAVRAAGELLAASARARPLLLLLDDAHFAEDVALDALEYAARAETERAPLGLRAGPPRLRAHPAPVGLARRAPAPP